MKHKILIVVWTMAMTIVGIIIAVAIRLNDNINSNYTNEIRRESYTLTYNNSLYYVMPSDLMEDNLEYSRVLKQYNISKNIKKENVGKCIYKTKNSILYNIKDIENQDILIMKDNMGEYVYAFSEKLFNEL